MFDFLLFFQVVSQSSEHENVLDILRIKIFETSTFKRFCVFFGQRSTKDKKI